jgi:hypothetical protein
MTSDQSRSTALVIVIVLLILALAAAAGFGWWAFQEREDYKNNFDKKVIEEVAKAKAQQKTELEAQFAEREKSPNKVFRGSATYGSIVFQYPKTWSGYADQSNTSAPINDYFYPDLVPSANQSGNARTAYALRLELLSTDYAQTIKQLDSQIEQGQLTVMAYVPPRLANVANVQPGTRFDGELAENIRGSMVVIKVRDKTLKIYTESPQYLSDFNNIVLKSLSFAP